MRLIKISNQFKTIFNVFAILVSSFIFVAQAKVCIIVNKELYPFIQTEAQSYISHVQTIEQQDVILCHDQFYFDPSWTAVQNMQKVIELRSYLQNRYELDGIEGAVLIGQLPIPHCEAIFTSDNERHEWPADYYYMNFNLEWVDENSDPRFLDGFFDNDDFVGDYRSTHIWVSRIIAHNLTDIFNPQLTAEENERNIIKAYLNRVTSRMTIALNDPAFPLRKGLMVGVQDMSPPLPYPKDVFLYSDGKKDTRANWTAGLQAGYETAVVNEHSMISAHKFVNTEGKWLTAVDYASLSPVSKSCFFFTHGCSAGKFSASNCINALYAMAYNGLAAYGWTTLSPCGNFVDKELITGLSFGQTMLSAIRKHKLQGPYIFSLIGAGTIRLMPYKLTNNPLPFITLPPEQEFSTLGYGRKFVQSSNGERIYFLNENKLYAINTTTKQIYGPVDFLLPYSELQQAGVPVVTPTTNANIDRLIFTYCKKLYWVNVDASKTDPSLIASGLDFSGDFVYNLYPKTEVNPDNNNIVYLNGCTNFFIPQPVDDESHIWAYDISTKEILWTYPNSGPMSCQFSEMLIAHDNLFFTATYGYGIRGSLFGLRLLEGTLIWRNPIQVFADRANITTTAVGDGGTKMIFVKGGDKPAYREDPIDPCQRIVKISGDFYPHQTASVMKRWIFDDNTQTSSPTGIIQLHDTKDVYLVDYNGNYIYEGGVDQNYYLSKKVQEGYRYVNMTPWYTCEDKENWRIPAHDWSGTDPIALSGDDIYEGTMYMLKTDKLQAHNLKTGVRFWEMALPQPITHENSSLLLLESGPRFGELYLFLNDNFTYIQTQATLKARNKLISKNTINANIAEWLFDTDQELAELEFTDITGWELDNNYLHTDNISSSAHFNSPFLTKKDFIIPVDTAQPVDTVLTWMAHRDTGKVEVEWSVGYQHSYGSDWHDNSILKVSVCDNLDNNLYTLVFKPNKEVNTEDYDLILIKTTVGTHDTLQKASTRTITPHGSNSPFVKLRISFSPTEQRGNNGRICVYYDCRDGSGSKQYIDVTDSEYSLFSHLRFEHETGNGGIINRIAVDEIRSGVYPAAPPPQIIIQPSSVSVEEECRLSLSITAEGPGDIFYTWYKVEDKKMVYQDTLGDFIIDNITRDKAGRYVCVVSTFDNYAVSDTVFVAVGSYCDSRGSTSYYEWISEVEIGEFINESGNAGCGGYSDFTLQCINMKKGNSYVFALSPGFHYYGYDENWRMWIDFNQDGDFNDADELVFAPNYSSYYTVSGVLTIPATASEGITRLRVSMSDYGPACPCGEFQYGEVEDYTVNITSDEGSFSIIGADFNSSSNGFSYKDDAFRNTNNPYYATGCHDVIALKVGLGNMNDYDIFKISGGWYKYFNLYEPANVTLSFYYYMRMSSEYECDEYSEVLSSIDGTLYSDRANDYITRLYGNGNGGPTENTGWQRVTINIGTLNPGCHLLKIGGYNNKKTFNDEYTKIWIDNVILEGNR